MKQLNVVQHFIDKDSKLFFQSRIADELVTQLRIIEKIIENNKEYIESPLSYNAVNGLLDQLKAYAPAIFLTGDNWYKSLTRDKPEGAEVPLINDDEDTLVAKKRREYNDRKKKK